MEEFEKFSERSNAFPRHSAPDPLDEQASPPLRFCRDCGAQLEYQAECPNCRGRDLANTQFLDAGSTREKYPIKSAVGLYFALLVSMGVLVFDPENIELQIGLTLFHSLIVILWALLHLKQVLPLFRPPSLIWIFTGAAIGVGTYGITFVFIGGLNLFLGLEADSYSRGFLSAGYGWGVVFLCIAVQPALIEEIAFRGVVFQALRGPLTLKEAMLVSSFMFAALHLSVLAFPHTFMIGILAVWLVAKTNSLWPGIALHFVHNSLALISEI